MPNMPNVSYYNNFYPSLNLQEYNYKIPAVASQSKIISGGSGGGMGAVYRGNAKKFVMNNQN